MQERINLTKAVIKALENNGFSWNSTKTLLFKTRGEPDVYGTVFIYNDGSIQQDGNNESVKKAYSDMLKAINESYKEG